MGMFDTVRCRYPLPHHQDLEFQTKDLASLVYRDHWLGGTMEEYEITEDGRLRRHAHERIWTEDRNAFLGGYLRSIRDWWEEVPDVHGDVVIYTRDENATPEAPAWVEFRIRFTNGRVQHVWEVGQEKEEISRPPADRGPPAD